MKPALLVLSHPDNLKKEYILKDFGNFISQYKIPHYLITNYPAEKATQKEFVGSYFHNFNPPGPFLGNIWKIFYSLKAQHVQVIPNWGYSGTHLLLQGFKFLKGLGYTHVIFLSYDIEPDFPKVKEFIDFSLSSFKLSKKGVFAEYPEALTTIKGIPQYENTIDTIQCACEIDFFVNIFEEGLKEYGYDCPLYQEKPGYLIEHFWEYLLRPYKEDINVISRSKALKGIYHSASSFKLDNGIPYYAGYNSLKNKIWVVIESFNLLDINLETQDSTEICFTKTLFDDLVLLEFDLKFGDECFISYLENNLKHKVHLFTYTPEWTQRFYFKNI